MSRRIGRRRPPGGRRGALALIAAVALGAVLTGPAGTSATARTSATPGTSATARTSATAGTSATARTSSTAGTSASAGTSRSTPLRRTVTRPVVRRSVARPKTRSRDLAAADSSVLSATGQVDSAPGQRIAGFGASGAWWPTDAAHFPATTRATIGRMLFGRDGLSLSRYRYNIGGGGVGVDNPYKAPPTFLRSGASYDWAADPAGLTFLRLAARYRVPTLIGFVNSAPAPFTTDHLSCGGQLSPSSIPAYAAFLAEVARHLAQQGLRLSYVSPMNEPDTSQPTCRQEGMAVPVGERARLVNAVAADLATVPGHPLVIADESSLVAQLVSELPRWLPAVDHPIGAVAHHAYDYPGPALLRRVAQLGVDHWATEICCFDGQDFGYQYDPTMVSGIWLADTIYSDLVVARDSAFDWWVALSPNIGCDPAADPGCQNGVHPAGRNDGLVYFDPNWRADGNLTLYTTKRYWVLAGFSRYVRPGAVLHRVGGLAGPVRAVAFAEGRRWVVVVVNDSATHPVELALRLPAGTDGAGTSAVVTDATSDLARIGVKVAGSALNLRLPVRSVSTLVVPGPGAHLTSRVVTGGGHRSGGGRPSRRTVTGSSAAAGSS